MRVSKALFLAVPFALMAFLSGSYLVRWLGVIIAGVILIVVLFGFEIQSEYIPRRKRNLISGKSDLERLTSVVKRAKKGKMAREIIAEEIREIYALLSDEYTRFDLKSNPNEALRLLHSEGDFYENLKKALEIVEADLNEDRRSA
ncbi:hypothetical protein [Thermococcus barophilus]|uniref:Putative exonuclease SbcC n=2 Tax=Thermococcus barophilus TaxID=55802 RepID=A0A0S1XEG2_THEBA|nr:hypothetical protein [Thermococcus barophilus]ADT84881.1 hypothetical membrane protein [Thermococcus barophilus MP]ALM76120.1 putative exonuclease SbcC [Thermococcus barophilus]